MKLPRSLLRRRTPAVDEPEAVVVPEPPPKPSPVPEPDPEPEPEPEPVLVLAPPLPAPEPVPALEPERPPTVVPLALHDQTPRAWNLWELERLGDGLDGGATTEERRLLLLHLRQFADPSGNLPVEFDQLVRDAFGADLAALPR
jgi:hypothetical protein